MTTSALKEVEEICGFKLTLGNTIWSIRRCDEITQTEFAKKLGVSKQYLSALENGKKLASVVQAKRFADILGYSDKQFIRLALQDMLDKHGLQYAVGISDAA